MFEHISTDAMKPILFGIIKNLTPKEFEIDFIDERAEKLPDTIIVNGINKVILTR